MIASHIFIAKYFRSIFYEDEIADLAQAWNTKFLGKGFDEMFVNSATE